LGFLGRNTPSTGGQWVAAFVQRLDELGWQQGRNVVIDYRWAEGRHDRTVEIASEFVQRKVDVIVTYGTSATLTVKQLTAVIPIVFATAGDPIGTGLVPDLAHPGGNVTGLSNEQTDTASKRVQLLKEIIPALRRLAILANVGSPNAVLDMSEAAAAAQSFDLEVVKSEIRVPEDIALKLDALKGRAEALYVCTGSLLTSNRTQIGNLALGARLPTMNSYREYVEAGGLMSYGPDFTQQFARAAEYVDNILRGTRAGDIPVEQPTPSSISLSI
jgi:putative ABC transport system substrate-binding protein